MIEIFAIVLLYTALKNRLALKGRGAGLAFLGPGLWVAGELAGAVAGAVVGALTSGSAEPQMALVYGCAIAGATAGAAIAFVVVLAVPPVAYECPVCASPFTPRLGRGLARTACKECGATLRIAGGSVREIAPKGRREGSP